MYMKKSHRRKIIRMTTKVIFDDNLDVPETVEEEEPYEEELPARGRTNVKK